MRLFSNNMISKEFYLSSLIAALPISFIAGNMIININLLLIIVSTLFIFKEKIFQIKYYFLDKLFILFFFFILFTGLLNSHNLTSNNLIGDDFFNASIKSFLFIKYFFFYIVLRFLIEKRIVKLKLFFLSCSIASLFVSFDIFFQFFYGVDILGFQGVQGKLSGPFGDELIAGGYLQRFSIFSFFIIPIFYSNSLSKYLKYLVPVLLIIFFIGIVLSGNRMPLLLFLLAVSLIVIFQKQTRKYFLHFIIISTLVFLLIFNLNSKVKANFQSFYAQISQMTTIVINKDFKNEKPPPYFREFATFYDTWLMRKYIGGGIKNFRYYCHMRPNIVKNSEIVCNMHPHNYYLEILTETGLVGLTIILLAFFILVYLTLYKKYFTKTILNQNKIIVPFIFLFIVEIFPLKSTGSFFTTGNTTYLFLILGILVGLMRRDILIENKN